MNIGVVGRLAMRHAGSVRWIKTWATRTQVIVVVGAVLTGLVLLVVTALIWGQWWRNPNLPTPEEWSALWGLLGLGALLFAWVQLRQVSESNQALIRANEESRRMAVESVRPRIKPSFQVDRSVFKDPSVNRGQAFFQLENTGPSAGLDVRVSVSPPFFSKSLHFKEGTTQDYFDNLNSSFGGEVLFETLPPGGSYIWLLAEIPELFREDTPRKYEVTVTYGSSVARDVFSEVHVIDLELEGHLDSPVNPIRRLGKQVEVLTDAVVGVKKQIASSAQREAPRLVVARRHRRGHRRPW